MIVVLRTGGVETALRDDANDATFKLHAQVQCGQVPAPPFGTYLQSQI
jgi:hypothetical protein